jgi:NHL repeat
MKTLAGPEVAPREFPSDAMLIASRQRADLLFREARLRRRKRRLLAGTVALAAGLVVAVIPWMSGNSASVHPDSSLHTQPPFSGSQTAPAAAVAPVALHQPEGLAVTPSGVVYIANVGSNQIIERQLTGELRDVAGNGHAGSSGDRGQAKAAELNRPVAVAVDQRGVAYVADSGNNRIRSIGTDGVIDTLARVPDPVALALGPNALLYVADSDGVQTVSSTGDVHTAIGSGTFTIFPGTPAQYLADVAAGVSVMPRFIAFDPDAIAVSPSGVIYVANVSPKVLLEYLPNDQGIGVIHDPFEIAQAYIAQAGLAQAPNGGVGVADYGAFAVDRTVGQSLTRVAGFHPNTLSGIHGTFRPSGVAVATDGTIYVDTDGANGGAGQPALASIDRQGRVEVLSIGR